MFYSANQGSEAGKKAESDLFYSINDSSKDRQDSLKRAAQFKNILDSTEKHAPRRFSRFIDKLHIVDEEDVFPEDSKLIEEEIQADSLKQKSEQNEQIVQLKLELKQRAEMIDEAQYRGLVGQSVPHIVEEIMLIDLANFLNIQVQDFKCTTWQQAQQVLKHKGLQDMREADPASYLPIQRKYARKFDRQGDASQFNRCLEQIRIYMQTFNKLAHAQTNIQIFSLVSSS